MERQDKNYSESSLNTFASCMHRYYLQYVMGREPDEVSLDLVFGKMSHAVLHDVFSAIFDESQYEKDVKSGKSPHEAIRTIVGRVCPQELEYQELKEKFGITSWIDYYTSVVIQFLKDFKRERDEYYPDGCELFFETRYEMSQKELHKFEGVKSTKPLVGVIDFLMIHRGERGVDRGTIFDFKFSNHLKGQSDFDQNSQLYIYALLAGHEFNVSPATFRIAYVSIPKASSGTPRVLKNGTLSLDKSQNVTAEDYLEAIIALHGPNHPLFSADGYYYNILQTLSLNRTAYTLIQDLDATVYQEVTQSVFAFMGFIDLIQTTAVNEGNEDKFYPRKFSAFQCKSCPYLKQCKPWITANFELDL